MSEVTLQKYKNRLSWRNRIGRLAWNIVCLFLFRPFSSNIFSLWRNFLLRCFGAKKGKGVHVYSSVRIWAPWNLVMGDYACLAPQVDCYNTAMIAIGDHATISQKSYLCASSHDISDPNHVLIVAPIIIGSQAWVAADAFVGMGVTIGEGAVVGARAVVTKDVEPWTVVAGNPAQFIKKRVLRDA